MFQISEDVIKEFLYIAARELSGIDWSVQDNKLPPEFTYRKLADMDLGYLRLLKVSGFLEQLKNKNIKDNFFDNRWHISWFIKLCFICAACGYDYDRAEFALIKKIKSSDILCLKYNRYGIRNLVIDSLKFLIKYIPADFNENFKNIIEPELAE